MGALGRGNRLAALGPSEGWRRGPCVEGREHVVVYVVAGDLIKGPFATDGCLFVGDFVKDFSVVDGPGERALPSFILVSLSLRESTPADLLPIVRPYWSTEISFRLRVISTGVKQVRWTHGVRKSPLRFRASEPRLTFLKFRFFSTFACRI